MACVNQDHVSKQKILGFFAPSDFMEHEVFRLLSHIRGNWDLQVDPKTGRYMNEEDSFGWLFNLLVDDLASAKPPSRYHDNEDRLGEYVQKNLNWGIRKQGKAWVNADGSRLNHNDYLAVMEQGGFDLSGIPDLLEAASGRIHAAIARGQDHFDEMEQSHKVILAGVLAAILYHLDAHEESLRLRAGECDGAGNARNDA